LRPEVAVVGAGPAGLLAAKRVAERGFSVQVYEEHSAVGEPCHCAGLISVEGLRRLGLEPREDFIQGEVYGGRVYAPSGEHMELRDSRPRAYVVDRSSFDRHLAERAADAGAELILSKRVEALDFNGGTAALRVRGGVLEPSVVIDAEGPGARLLGQAGHDAGQRGLLNGFNAELDGVEVEQGMVELWFGDSLAGGFFAWVIPTGDGEARCGLASRGDGLACLKGFLRNRFGVEPQARVRAGRVCTGGPVQRTVYGNVLLVGDAAGQVKPTTGGGVVLGGLCAGIAGDVASEHLGDGRDLGRYEGLWRRRYGHEFSLMLALRGLMNGLGDERLSRALQAFKEEGLQARAQMLLERGDVDMQAGVIREALTDPAMLATMVRSLGRVALGELLSLVQGGRPRG
jgi:geranylgeranyl reductase family protein